MLTFMGTLVFGLKTGHLRKGWADFPVLPWQSHQHPTPYTMQMDRLHCVSINLCRDSMSMKLPGTLAFRLKILSSQSGKGIVPSPHTAEILSRPSHSCRHTGNDTASQTNLRGDPSQASQATKTHQPGSTDPGIPGAHCHTFIWVCAAPPSATVLTTQG